MLLDALREKSMDVSVGGYLKQNMASRRQRKREKVAAGPGSRELKAGYETNSCAELRVKLSGLCALIEGAEHECTKVGVANRTSLITQEIERDGGSMIIRVKTTNF